MKEILGDLARWRRAGRRAVVARVIEIEGSSPRGPGAAMAVADDGEVAGSVSGGCVEGAVVGAALEVHVTRRPQLSTFGYSDDDAFSVGLTCGGTIRLFLEPWDRPEIEAALGSDQPVALATVVSGDNAGASVVVRPGRALLGSSGDPDLDRVVARDGARQLAAGATGLRRYGPRGEEQRDDVAVFLESYVPPPQMLIFGAVDFTAALVRQAKHMGYRVTVCDARPMFATRRRFPLADDVVVDWPSRLLERVGGSLTARDAICVLTHDYKFDVPAIAAAVRTAAGYIGAMGSRRTHSERIARLRDAGLTAGELGRLHSPIGLDVGARTPEETAVAICAELIATQTGRLDVRSLRDTEGAIHGLR